MTGATITSDAVLLAVSECLKQAGANLDDWNKEVVKVAGEDIELTADVIVIGGGGAGLAAAAAAGDAGASVILIEKGSALGGNTILSGGAYNAADPEMQQKVEMSEATRKELLSYLDFKEEDFGDFAPSLTILKDQISQYVASGATYLFDSPELHIIQCYIGAKREALDGTVILPNYELISNMCYKSLDTLHWMQELGLPTEIELTTAVGALWMRTHNIGAKALISTLNDYALNKGAEIMFNTKATELTMEDGKVVGVIAEQKDGTKVILHANKGVVLATGGFAGSVELVAKYNTYWPNFSMDIKTDNTPNATGDGIFMAEAVGANTLGMGFTQMLPTCSALDGTAGKGVGSRMYINREGLRYVNENSERDVLSSAALAQTDGMFFGVGDVNMYNSKNSRNENAVAEGEAKGYWYCADTLEEVANEAGVNAENLLATIEKFNSYVDNQEDPEFGRYSFLGKIGEGPYILVPMAPALHHTMGGVEINIETQVIDTNGNVIPGLYAAGEVTGGIHAGNRLGGNAIADIIIYGRIAGANAAIAK